jgi:F-type H+-transporting ATPase subunit alpha
MYADTLEKEIGFVRANKHYLLSIEGLPSARVYDIIRNEQGGRAIVTALSHDAVEAMVLDPMEPKPGQQFELSERGKQFSIGDYLFGRVINALGDPIDGKGAFPPKNMPLSLEVEAPGLAGRASISKQLVTGYGMTDTILPIGKGQRQLLMGPVRSGADVFARETIRHQAQQGVICIYAAVGKPATYIREAADHLLEGETAAYTVILAVSADDPTPQIRIAPSVALMLAEYWCDQGKDVLLVIDDFYTHAKYLREAALLEGKLPGRESYPGDIFYQQAHLIERAGSFEGKGTITMFPLLQTDLESYTDLITTNIMGTTDGHVSFSSELYAQGVFPSITEHESVTRVGKHAQSVVQKQLSTAIASVLADARAQERFAQFGTQLSETAQSVLRTGDVLRFLLNQDEDEFQSVEAQAIVLSLPLTSFATDKDKTFFEKNRKGLVEAASTHKDTEPLRKAVHELGGHAEFLGLLEKFTPFFLKLCQP